jgi:hypothetical protein
MEGRFNDLELLFIKEVLDQHGEYVIDLMQAEIEKKKIRDTDTLLQSLHYKVTNYGIDPVLQISFMSYGRALEIRWHKRSGNTKKWVTDTNKVVWGADRKPRKRKNVLFYTRNVYGSQNRLIQILASEFDEHEKARLKSILDKQIIQAAV